VKRPVPRLVPVGLMGIPRADKQIAKTIATLRVAQFEQDPLFDVGDSFRLSLMNSAVKREGAILEAAIQDAIEQQPDLRLIEVSRTLKRIPDVQFEVRRTGLIVALEIKRGTQHDSRTIKSFVRDLIEIPELLRNALILFPIEDIRFHLVFISGILRIKEGLTLDALGNLYGLHATSYVKTARQRYSAAIKALLRERGL
jgi:hypothetical protein